jgi:hypothetical protein
VLPSSKRLDRIEALQEQICALQEKMHERIRDIDVALIVREPGTARAAEAYEGLRRSVATAARERRQHLAQLAEMTDAIERGATVETLRQRCEQWCVEAGLERRSDAVPEWYSVVEGEGPVLEVIVPAWVDSASGQLVKQGVARRVAGREQQQQQPPPEGRDEQPERPAVVASEAVSNDTVASQAVSHDAVSREVVASDAEADE